jgi:hypothetical protein
MSAYTNEFGLIDIGRAGCANDRFLATWDEIREANASPEPQTPDGTYWTVYSQHFGVWSAVALIAFFFVNMLGLLLLLSRTTLRWIGAGFRKDA